MMPHIGCHDGIWYGMGYNFAGVPMGSFFGLKIAQKILGLPDEATRLRGGRVSHPAVLSRQSVVPAAGDALLCLEGRTSGAQRLNLHLCAAFIAGRTLRAMRSNTGFCSSAMG